MIDDKKSVTVRTKRPYYPKTRTGCLTCKIRRVKCDETRPACRRCTLTGRSCDGYNSPKTLLFEICTDPRERRSFDFFRQCTVPEIAEGSDAATFWKRLILQAAYSKEAVRHAIVAIGAYHEAQEAHESDQALTRFAYEQQNRAIEALMKPQPLLVSTEDVLLACILFVFLENLQCNFDAAVVHLQNGLEIVRDWKNRQAGESSLHSSTAGIIDNELSPILDRLAFLASTLSGLHRLSATTTTTATTTSRPALPDAFFDLKDAHAHFYHMLRWICQQLQSLEQSCTPATTNGPLEALKDQAIAHLTTWRHLLEDLDSSVLLTNPLQAPVTQTDQNIQEAGVLHMKIQHAILEIMLRTLPYATETPFDLHTATFSSILTHTQTLDSVLRLLPSPDPIRLASKVLRFTPRLTVPLYFTASRCRHPHLRRLAQALLRTIRRREGVFVSEVAADLARAVMRYEESTLGPDPSGQPMTPSPFPPPAPPPPPTKATPAGTTTVPETRRLVLVNETTFAHSSHTSSLALYPRAFNDPQWAKLVCRRSGLRRLDGENKYVTLWLDRRTGAVTEVPSVQVASQDAGFPSDVPGLFPQITQSDSKLWLRLRSGIGDRYMGRFACNTIFSEHGRSFTLEGGDYVNLAGELTQYTASEM